LIRFLQQLKAAADSIVLLFGRMDSRTAEIMVWVYDMINILSSKTCSFGFSQQQSKTTAHVFISSFINDEASFATKSELLKAIDDLRTYATVQ
jgi:hypothetical protein